jgi:hypothetical protein
MNVSSVWAVSHSGDRLLYLVLAAFALVIALRFTSLAIAPIRPLLRSIGAVVLAVSAIVTALVLVVAAALSGS